MRASWGGDKAGGARGWPGRLRSASPVRTPGPGVHRRRAAAREAYAMSDHDDVRTERPGTDLVAPDPSARRPLVRYWRERLVARLANREPRQRDGNRETAPGVHLPDREVALRSRAISAAGYIAPDASAGTRRRLGRAARDRQRAQHKLLMAERRAAMRPSARRARTPATCQRAGSAGRWPAAPCISSSSRDTARPATCLRLPTRSSRRPASAARAR